MGLTASQAVRLLFHRIAVDQAFPLELKVPNAETRVSRVPVDTTCIDDADQPSGSVYFARAGTHAQLFE